MQIYSRKNILAIAKLLSLPFKAPLNHKHEENTWLTASKNKFLNSNKRKVGLSSSKTKFSTHTK